MSKLVIESINDGSIATVCGGQTIIDEKADKVLMPPKAVKKAKVSNIEENFITMPLISDRVLEEQEASR